MRPGPRAQGRTLVSWSEAAALGSWSHCSPALRAVFIHSLTDQCALLQGPACYRKNGYPAITDANLVLGRLLPSHFPQIFGESEDQPLDVDASRAALEALRTEINAASGQALSLDEVAWGFVQVANETMCRPIRSLTEARGYDTSRHVLACFGGAGGQHACALAGTLGIDTGAWEHPHESPGLLRTCDSAVGRCLRTVCPAVLIHRFSSVLSAYGMAVRRLPTLLCLLHDADVHSHPAAC